MVGWHVTGANPANHAIYAMIEEVREVPRHGADRRGDTEDASKRARRSSRSKSGSATSSTRRGRTLRRGQLMRWDDIKGWLLPIAIGMVIGLFITVPGHH